jgi:glycosyltransferase involved in cell wall biosynthesis
MRCPRLNELPDPLSGKSGWPWTLETPPLSDVMPGGAAWPVISIVVASLNQSRFIEEMIRSILLQGYPALELILIDGGSNRETLEVIAKYEQWLSYWVSESDRGQSHAFNKGLARITGKLFNIFSTDDYFLPGSLGLIADGHMRHPDKIIAGAVIFTWDGNSRSLIHFPQEQDRHAYAQWWKLGHHAQPGLFYPSRYLSSVGNVDENLHYSMDYEFTLRYLAFAGFAALRCPIAVIRNHAACKSVRNGDYCVWECMQISKTYQRMFPDIDAEANRHAAGILFGFGFRRLLYRQGDSWRFMREGLLRHPFWAIYWLFPGWLLRQWSKLRAA